MKALVSFQFLVIYVLLWLGWCYWRGHKRLLVTSWLGLIVLLYLMSTIAFNRLLQQTVKVYPPLTQPQQLAQQDWQAIMVLGGGYYLSPETGADIVAGGQALSRSRYAARLARLTGLPVAATGIDGIGIKNTLEKEFGVPVRWLEGESKDTHENAAFSAKLLLPQGIKRLVLVTDMWHMGRARVAFEHNGFTVLPATTDYIEGFYPEKPSVWRPRADIFFWNMYALSGGLGEIKYRIDDWLSPPTPVPAPLPTTAHGS